MRTYLSIVEGWLAEDAHEADSLRPIFPQEASHNPNFQKWFAGSKVVDEKGLPLIVYRGRSTRWTVMPTGNVESLRTALQRDNLTKSFEPEMEFAERLGDVAWFTDDEYIADGYHDGAKDGDVLAAYLCLKNPLILSVDMLGQEEAQRRISEITGEEKSLTGRFSWNTPRKMMADHIVYDNSVVIAWARKHGHDSVIHDDHCIRGRTVHTSYVAFAPHQIKAIENTGEFSQTDPNIHR